MTPDALPIKEKTDIIKIKNPYASKDSIQKVKRHFTKREKKCASHIPDKGLKPGYIQDKKRNNATKIGPRLQIFLQRRYTNDQ